MFMKELASGGWRWCFGIHGGSGLEPQALDEAHSREQVADPAGLGNLR